MSGVQTYPVLSRIRRSGVLYAPDTERDTIDLELEEAARLMPLGCLGDALSGAEAMDESLADRLRQAIEAEHDVRTMTMKELHKLLGGEWSWMRKPDVEAALAEIDAGED